MNQAQTGTSRVSPVATSEISPCSFSAKSSALAKICFRPARIVVPFATKRRPTAGLRQFIEKCDAVTLPTNVAAANPQAVSSNAAIIPACRCPAYWVKSSRHRMRISSAPAPGGDDLECRQPVERGGGVDRYQILEVDTGVESRWWLHQLTPSRPDHDAPSIRRAQAPRP